MSATKDVELAVDADGDGLSGPGDTLRYLIRARNISRRPVTGVVVGDQVPAHTIYVPGSTLLNTGSGTVVLPDNTAGLTPFPLDEEGASLGTLPVGAVFTISFLVVVDNPLPPDVRTVVNRALVRSDRERIEAEAVTPLVPWKPRPSLALEKRAVVETVGSSGTGTIGYWKNHPEAWPVAEISVGGHSYSRDEALTIMGTPGRGDKTYDLFRQFVAARLNVLAGSDASCVTGMLAAADAWLSQHPPGSAVRSVNPAWRNPGAGLHASLDDYNNGLLCAPHRDAAGAGTVRHDVVFTLIVTNTGNVDLTGVSVQDPAMPACGGDIGTLAAFGGSASLTCRAEGVRGDLTNGAVASGAAPDRVSIDARAEVFVDVPDVASGGGTPGGVRSLSHWRARPEAWPVSALTLGGATRTRQGILDLLDGCRRGNPCELSGQLAAARLNLLAGADPACVERVIGAADTWLAKHPPGRGLSARSPAWRKAGKRLNELLARYNLGLLCAPAAVR
jgi:uncharacterized repeat protein (TIGR01451 family)